MAWHNRGHALRGLARYEDAVASYDRAIAMKPDYAEAHFNAGLTPLKDFILPGGTRAASLAHVARTACRRAERVLVALHAESPQPAVMMQYLNRLSDLLFVMARLVNHRAGAPEVEW